MDNASNDQLHYVLPDLFRIDVPLPNFIEKKLNVYLIIGNNSHTLIDLGESHPFCRQAIMNALARADLNWKDTSVLFTHLHPDHIGCLKQMDHQDIRLFGHFFNTMQLKTTESAISEKYMPILDSFMGQKKRSKGARSRLSEAVELASANATVEYLIEDAIYSEGDFNLRVIESPGHEDSHICFYEGSKKLLFTGDLLLRDSFPFITSYSIQENTLQKYFESLEKVMGLEVDLVLPGHGEAFSDLEERVIETREFHERKVHKVKDLVQSGASSFTDILSAFYSAVPDFEKSPPHAQFFLAGQVFSYLVYLLKKGDIDVHITKTGFNFDPA